MCESRPSDDFTGALALILQRVISAVGRVLEAFDDDNIIPAYGFGDSQTQDKGCLALFEAGTTGCRGFDHVLQRYNEITPSIKLYGPTSFAPLIYKAIETTKQERGYHILVIIADGRLSQLAPTRDAIVEASKYPLCEYSRLRLCAMVGEFQLFLRLLVRW